LVHSLSQRLVARYFALLLVISGVVSALVHPLPNLTDMTGGQRAAITLTCLLGGLLIWTAPWDRWPRWSLLFLPPVGLAIKLWANLHGGLGPYSYAIHFALIYVWMGVALPRWTPLAFAPLLVVAYSIPLWLRGDPRQAASVAMVVPICVLIGESVAWISNRLREVEQVDGQRMHRMAWLVEASADLARQHDRPGLAQRVAQLANELPAAAGAALLLPGPGRILEVAASAAWPGRLPDRFALRDEPALIEALRSGEIVNQEDELAAALAAELGVPGLGVAPLRGSSRCVGLVLLVQPAGVARFDSFTRDLVFTLQLQAGLAVERLRDHEALRDSSLHDELTKLGNRRKANARLEQLAPGDVLVLIDLDHFKRVNDTHGHAAGDEVLRSFACFLTDRLREGDSAFRMGGEEFLLVFQQANEGGVTGAERLCEAWRFGDPVTTFSAGVCVHTSGRTANETLRRADAALYQAKNAGRDRVAAAM
jgi:diguanylate cyclase (GGDEF)-like protein